MKTDEEAKSRLLHLDMLDSPPAACAIEWDAYKSSHRAPLLGQPLAIQAFNAQIKWSILCEHFSFPARWLLDIQRFVWLSACNSCHFPFLRCENRFLKVHSALWKQNAYTRNQNYSKLISFHSCYFITFRWQTIREIHFWLAHHNHRPTREPRALKFWKVSLIAAKHKVATFLLRLQFAISVAISLFIFLFTQKSYIASQKSGVAFASSARLFVYT